MNFEKYFKGYDVPKKIRNASEKICFRFAINGLADPMYIANIIAQYSSSGDGNSNLTADIIQGTQQIAKALQGSYGCNISRLDIQEVEKILETGQLDKEIAIKGMQQFIARDKQQIVTCKDVWRIDFLTREIETLQRHIKELS